MGLGGREQGRVAWVGWIQVQFRVQVRVSVSHGLG